MIQILTIEQLIGMLTDVDIKFYDSHGYVRPTVILWNTRLIDLHRMIQNSDLYYKI